VIDAAKAAEGCVEGDDEWANAEELFGETSTSVTMSVKKVVE
jgi:hypothetical protein